VLALLQRPLSPGQAAAAGLIVLAAGGAYCFTYTLLQGAVENPLVGAGWAAANLLPWLVAFEAAKRLPEPRRRAGTMVAIMAAAAAVLSLLTEAGLGLIAAERTPDLAFQLLRRVPGAGLFLFLILALPAWQERRSAASDRAADPAPELPLLAHQIDWIKAAGNYLEFHCAAGPVLRRMTMAQAETLLARAGFVRIHRSAMVNAARIARVRRGKLVDEVELVDGRRLKVGGAYRARVAPLERRLAA